MTIFVGVRQWNWLKSRGSASRVIRNLIDQHIRKAEELEAPRFAAEVEALDLDLL
jgi:hypothetical protein